MRKITFTDGTFILAPDKSDVYQLDPGTHEVISPCTLIACSATLDELNYDNSSYEYTKTDTKGNTWVFSYNNSNKHFTLKINSISRWVDLGGLNPNNYLGQGFAFVYFDTSDTLNLAVTGVGSLYGASLTRGVYAVTSGVSMGVLYNNVGSSDYPTVSKMIEYFNSKNVTAYNITNINTLENSRFLSTYSLIYTDGTYLLFDYNTIERNLLVPISSSGQHTPLGAKVGAYAVDTSIAEEYNPISVIDTDPYGEAGDSETGGGDGTFDGTSDPIPIPSLPTVGATDAGFITLYAPTTTQLKNLAYTCWVGLLDDVWTNFRKLFSDPMDCILGLSVVPVTVPTSGTQDVAIGNIPTGVSMNVASQQYIEVDCGTVSFTNGYFGSYLDYEPYTKIAIYLPYIGVHQLNTDDIMGRTIQVVYHIDILTGSCIAFVKCGDSVLYQYNGACASNIPVNSLNYASTIENAIRIAVNIGTTVATAGASAPLSIGSETAGAGIRAAQNVARGVSMAGATAEGALSMKPSIGRSGSLGGTTGLMGTQYPYMIITRPKLCRPKNQNNYKGYPSFIQTTVGELEGQGYTEFDTVLISNSLLTDEENAELEAILKGGVYL